MRSRLAPFIAIATLLAVAACSSSRNLVWSQHPADTVGLTSVSIADDDALHAEISGLEHRVTWLLDENQPPGAHSRGFAIALPDEELLAVSMRDGESMSSIAPLSYGSSEPWVRLSRGLGTITIWHATGANETTGRIDLQFAPAPLATIRNAGWQPTGREALHLLLTETSAEQLVAYRDADEDLSLTLACALARHGTDTQEYRAFADATRFDDLEVARLLHHGVSLTTTVEWYELGTQASADELIYCAQRNLLPELAVAWRDAGESLSFEELYWAKQRNVKPDHHRAWAEANHALNLKDLYWVNQRNITAEQYTAWSDAGYPLDREQLYWVRQRNVTPAHYGEWTAAGKRLDHEQLYWARQRNIKADTWLQWSVAGREMSLEQLYWTQVRGIKAQHAQAWREIGQPLDLEELADARQYGLTPEVAGTWRKLGYAPSLDKLKELRLHGITPQFAQRYLSPKYELPTFEQLKDYRLYGKKPADVNKLRRPVNAGGSQ